MNKNEATFQDDTTAEQSVFNIPLVEETLKLDKKVITTEGIRLIKKVDEQIVHVPLVSRKEGYTIERVPVDKFVEQAPAAIRYEGNTMIVSVIEEETIIQKRLKLVEELRITLTTEETVDEHDVKLRKEHIIVDRTHGESEKNTTKV
jgi:stress response protein YsnF